MLRRAVDELAEAALVPRGRFLLVKKLELAFVELLEELVPGNLLERGVALAEVKSEQAGIVVVAGSLHAGRTASTLFGPAANGFVIGSRFGRSHGAAPGAGTGSLLAERETNGVVPAARLQQVARSDGGPPLAG